jgi:hypothetical protein
MQFHAGAHASYKWGLSVCFYIWAQRYVVLRLACMLFLRATTSSSKLQRLPSIKVRQEGAAVAVVGMSE